MPSAVREEAAPSLNDLRAAVDALKKPRRPELVADADSGLESTVRNEADESPDAARRA